MRALALACLLLPACDKDEDTGAPADTGTPADTRPEDDGGGGPGGPGPGGAGDTEGPVSPEITRADAWCQEYTTGTKYWVWIIEAEAEDPQGNKTLLPHGSPGAVYKDGALIREFELTCSEEGYCFASWQEKDEPLCAIVSQYTVEVQISDLELNLSEPAVIEPWRMKK